MENPSRTGGLLRPTGTWGRKQRSGLFEFAPLPRSFFDRNQLSAFVRAGARFLCESHGAIGIETPAVSG
jgi:hypothetical protein